MILLVTLFDPEEPTKLIGTWDEALMPLIREGTCGWCWHRDGMGYAATHLVCAGEGSGLMTLTGVEIGADYDPPSVEYYPGGGAEYPVGVSGLTPGPDWRSYPLL